MFVQKSQGQTVFAATHFSRKTVSGFPASISAVRREAPLRISCWNPMWPLQFPERRVMAFESWLWGNHHHHRQEVETTWNVTLQWMYMTKGQHMDTVLEKKNKKLHTPLQPQWRANILLTLTCKCTKMPHRHIPITAPPSSEAFIINRGNHRRLLIGDALVGVSEVSRVLSLSICKLSQLGE